MLNYNFQKKLENILQPEMEKYFKTEDAKKLLSGKESGHIMGTIVEELCGDILKENGLRITKEVNILGEEKKRAHSDFNIGEHRVNVKLTVSNKKGQPNTCSVNRMMNALRDNNIDSYYMLNVKYDDVSKTTKVYFVDILDYTDCLTCNGGTGQIMLKQKDFYKTYDSRKSSSELSLSEKKKIIYNMYITKMNDHLLLKRKQLKERENELLLFS